MRALPLAIFCVLLLLAVALARPAAAEEVFVLDNGEVLRGWVIRDDGDVLLVRLSGFMGEAKVQLKSERILRRFVSTEKGSDRPETPEPTDWARTAKHVSPTPDVVPHDKNALIGLPAEEPDLKDEGFFHRMARVIVLSVPQDIAGRFVIGLLLFGALLSLVALGGRVAEIDTMGAVRSIVLAVLLGTFLAVDVWLYQDILRADRAIWIVPLQGVIWIAAALGLTRCGAARVVLLFAFVLFSLAVVLFISGAILVSF